MIALYVFVVIPLWVFIRLFFVCGILVFIINLIRKIMDKRKISYTLFAFLPAFLGSIACFIVIVVGGFSFKYVDWQYYKFKELCKGEGVIINYLSEYKALKEEYGWNTIYNEPIKVTSRIEEHSYYTQLNNGIKVYEYKFYTYKYFGIFLVGDAGAGFDWITERTTGCKPYKNKEHYE